MFHDEILCRKAFGDDRNSFGGSYFRRCPSSREPGKEVFPGSLDKRGGTVKAEDLRLGCKYYWAAPMGRKDVICMGSLSGEKRVELDLAISNRAERVNFFVVFDIPDVGIISLSDEQVTQLIESAL